MEIAYQGASDFSAQQDLRTIPVSVVDELRRLPEVGAVYPTSSLSSVYVIGRDGKVVGGNGPPGLALNYTGARNLAGKPIITLASGRLPHAPYEVAMDVDTARKAGLRRRDR